MLNFLYQCYEKFPVITSAGVGAVACGIVAMANPIGWIAAGVGLCVWGMVEEVNKNLNQDEFVEVTTEDYFG